MCASLWQMSLTTQEPRQAACLDEDYLNTKIAPQSMHSFAAMFCPVSSCSHDLPRKGYNALHPYYTEAPAAPCRDSELYSMLKGASPMRRM